MAYAPLAAAAKYFSYYLKAANGRGHGTHSPFVYDFIKNILNAKTADAVAAPVEAVRKSLLKNKRELIIQDFGAGSATTKSNTRTIASIAKNAAKPAKFAQLLYRIASHYKYKNILELGTSLGITTAYLAKANAGAKVITLEGASAIAKVAKENFDALQLKNIEIITGNFDDTLAGALKAMPVVDLAFIDGNHRQQPTERYFQQLLPHIHNKSMVVLDDIHWSKGMEAAWRKVCSHPEVTCSIDLFFIGIVVFDKSFKQKQHFSIRF